MWILVFAASVWIAFDSFDSALRITAATMQATCWSGEAAIVRSGARHVLPSRILTSAISAANQISGSQTGAIGADTGGHRATSSPSTTTRSPRPPRSSTARRPTAMAPPQPRHEHPRQPRLPLLAQPRTPEGGEHPWNCRACARGAAGNATRPAPPPWPRCAAGSAVLLAPPPG